MKDPNENDKIYARLVWLITFAFAGIVLSAVCGKPLLIFLIIAITTIIATNIIDGDNFFF